MDLQTDIYEPVILIDASCVDAVEESVKSLFWISSLFILSMSGSTFETSELMTKVRVLEGVDGLQSEIGRASCRERVYVLV